MDNEAWVLVEPGREAAFEARLARLNRKATDIGLAEIEIVERKPALFDRGAEFVGRDGSFLLNTLKRVVPGSRARRPVILTEVLVRFPLIVVDGWEVLGRLEQAEHGVLAFSSTPRSADWAVLDEQADRGVRCEHCNTRRNRSDAYVLRHRGGEVKTVGSSCLQDYTGIDPGRVLFLADLHQLLRVVEGETESFYREGRRNAVGTEEYLGAVVASIRRGSFVSSSDARDTGVVPTWQEALEHCGGSVAGDAMEVAAEIRRQVISDGERGGFDRTAALLIRQEVVATKPLHLAVLAGAVASHLSRQAPRPSRHAGTPGRVWEGEVRLVRKLQLPNPYSRTQRWMLLMDTGDGARLVWRTTAAPDELLRSEGATLPVLIRAKVKEHSQYEGAPQTVVTHVQVVGEASRRAA